jgi:ferredoxin-NADP reductase
VGVLDDRSLVTPDFVGNFFFNTLGNLAVEPRAGLAFPDFATGDLLLAACHAEVQWEGPEVEAFAGAERLVRFHLTRIVRLEGVLPFRGGGPSYARELARTGTWEEAGRALAARKAQATWRPFRVARTVDESATVRSFFLEPADGAGLAPHRPGEFLPIRITPDGREVVRPYSLSDAKDGRAYRISVKREGFASSWLHDFARPGSMLEALPPRGQLVWSDTGRPIALVSAGIGVAPMVAILNGLLVNDCRARVAQPILFLHGARNGREHPFAAEVRHKAAHHESLTVHVAYSAPDPEDSLGSTHDSVGRIDRALLARLLPTLETDVYVCGPRAFMQSVYDALRALGMRDERIRFEVFGGSGPTRAPAIAASDDERAAGPMVAFVRSGKRQRWLPRFETLLECAEAAGVVAGYACRSGVCGTCATRVLAGETEDVGHPVAATQPGEVLTCCARPRGPLIELDL